MIISPFEFLPTVVGFVVYWIAYRVLVRVYPEGITARNLARTFQIIAVFMSGSIISPLTLNPFGILSTLLYVGFLITNLILVNILIKAGKFLKLQFQAVSTKPSSLQVFNSISEWSKPYRLKLEPLFVRLKEYLERVKNNPIVRMLLSALKWSFVLIELFIYPYIIKPLVFDLFIFILQFIEKWVDWLSENILATVLGEIFTKIVQFVSLFSVTIPRYILEIIRKILDQLFKK
jgi:hypothetical protein